MLDGFKTTADSVKDLLSEYLGGEGLEKISRQETIRLSSVRIRFKVPLSQSGSIK